MGFVTLNEAIQEVDLLLDEGQRLFQLYPAPSKFFPRHVGKDTHVVRATLDAHILLVAPGAWSWQIQL